MNMAAAKLMKPTINCMKHFGLEDVWIPGFLADYLNIKKVQLVGHVGIIKHPDVWKFAKVNAFPNFSTNKSVTLLEINNTFLHIDVKNYLVNTLHLNRIKPEEIRCFWKKNTTLLQIFLDGYIERLGIADEEMKFLSKILPPSQNLSFRSDRFQCRKTRDMTEQFI